MKEEEKKYEDLTKKIKPKRPIVRNVIWAFIIGGLICVVAQIFFNLCEIMLGLELKEAVGASIALMIFLGALLTGLGIYDDLGDFSGAGSAVPITGFANSVVSPALEFKSEGYILGLGSKIFTVAGPVITYGSITAVILAWIVSLIKG